MKGFRITRLARKDLIDIWNRIVQDRNPQTADRILAGFHDAIQMLLDFPGAGHTRADVTDPRYRFWSVSSFVIAYRPDLKPLTIARVIHGARDFTKLF